VDELDELDELVCRESHGEPGRGEREGRTTAVSFMRVALR
jgi:hypothetical protein